MSETDPSPDAAPRPEEAQDAATPLPRFCSTCGAGLAQPGGPCAKCSARAARLEVADQQARAGGRPLRAALGLYGVILGVHLTSWIIAALLLSDLESRRVEMQWVVQGIDTLIVVAWCLTRRRDVTPMVARGAPVRWFFTAFLMSFVTWGIATVLMEGVRAVTSGREPAMTGEFFEAGYGWAAVIGTICVQPGVVEELAFRGVILGALLHVMRPREAILVSAIMFAGLHLSPITFPHLIIMGSALAWLQVRTGSIYPGMVLHFCHNLWCCLAEPLHLFGGNPHDP